MKILADFNDVFSSKMREYYCGILTYFLEY